ncbi:hypothetical protein TI05_16290 [Achromatium sp. WMS3]|nr:hypothetical protein TI05_16290 [Achromatium sp. WMS3]
MLMSLNLSNQKNWIVEFHIIMIWNDFVYKIICDLKALKFLKYNDGTKNILECGRYFGTELFW